MTHASVPAEDRAKLGITDNFIRLSVGIEDVEDIMEDLHQAFEIACKGKWTFFSSACLFIVYFILTVST